jgi:hypothetical protein
VGVEAGKDEGRTLVSMSLALMKESDFVILNEVFL